MSEIKNLACVQADFQAYITAPSYGAFEKIKTRMLSHTDNQYGLDSESRLEIYYDMYRLRLLDVLFTDYPKLVGIMSEEKFTRAFLHYLMHYPSTHYSVRPFGENMAKFLSNFEPFCLNSYYSEMAQFEWALSLTYDAADAEHIHFERLQTLSPEEWIDLKFKLHPSVSLLSFEHNIVSVWKALDAHKILPEQDDESVLERYPEHINPESLITPLSSKEIWMIWRKDFATKFLQLNSEQYMMLEAIHQGLSFADVCEQLTKIMAPEEVPNFVMHCLAEWLDFDVLTTF